MKKYLILLSVVTVLFVGCNDLEVNDKGKIVVYLTDSPAEYEEVLIDVQELLVHTDDSGWMELPLEVKGQIDLLELTNGKDTLLTDEDFPTGKISQMRMILGNNNQVKVDGVIHDLSTPSAQQSGLKFNIHADIEPGVTYKMWIDFDASRSIVEKGNGTYSLKPVIKVFTEAASGSIVGTVAPAESKSLVQAISSSDDTTGTYADETSGEFIVRGLDAGTYKVKIQPIDGYQEVEKEDIAVEIGVSTDIGIIDVTDSN